MVCITICSGIEGHNGVSQSAHAACPLFRASSLLTVSNKETRGSKTDHPFLPPPASHATCSFSPPKDR